MTRCIPDEEEMAGYTECQAHTNTQLLLLSLFMVYHPLHPISQDSGVRTPPLATLLGTQPRSGSTLWASSWSPWAMWWCPPMGESLPQPWSPGCAEHSRTGLSNAYSPALGEACHHTFSASPMVPRRRGAFSLHFTDEEAETQTSNLLLIIQRSVTRASPRGERFGSPSPADVQPLPLQNIEGSTIDTQMPGPQYRKPLGGQTCHPF